VYVAEEKVGRVFIDAVPPNLGRLNVDRGGKDMTDLDLSNTNPLTELKGCRPLLGKCILKQSSVPEFLRTFKKKKRTRPVTSGYIKKCKSLKDVQPSKRISGQKCRMT